MHPNFDAWLAQPGNFRCHIVEIDCIDNVENKTLYFSNAPFVSSPTDTPANTPYTDVITDDIKLGGRMDDVFYGRTTTIRSAISILATNFVDNLLSFDVSNQPVRIYMGDPSWSKSDFKLLGTWFAQDIEPDGVNYRLPILDATHPLDVPVCNKYTTGFAEGKTIPRVFGTVFNAEPVLIDELGDGTYQINDGAITSLVVRDGGLVVAATVDLAAGTFTLNTAPQGRITCDVEQANQTCSAIVLQLLAEASMSAKTGTFSSVPGYTLGAYINDDSSKRDLIDQACISTGFAWVIDNSNLFNTVEVKPLTGVGSALLTDDDIDPDTFKPKRRILPAPIVNVHYSKNYTVQPDGLFGAVSQANRVRFGREYSVVNAINANVAATYPAINAYTLLVNKADAEIEASKRAALNTNIRKVFEMSAYGSAIDFALGMEIDTSMVSDMQPTAFVMAVEPIPALGLAVIEVMQ